MIHESDGLIDIQRDKIGIFGPQKRPMSTEHDNNFLDHIFLSFFDFKMLRSTFVKKYV